MKIKFTLLILPLLFFSFLLTSHPLQAKAYVSTAGKFSVDFPSAPTVTQVTEKTAVGAIGENIYKATTKNGEFTVEYSILPEIAVVFGGHHTIYGKAKDGFLKKSGSTEISFKEMPVDGKKGSELEYKTPSGQEGKARFVLEGKRFYVILAQSSQGAASIDPFLNSFKLLP